jgi:flagellar protein FliJ
MSPFTFNLQTLLEQRRESEDAAQRELAKLLREHMVLQTQLRSMSEAVRHERAGLSSALTGQVDVGRAHQYAAHVGQVQVRSRQIVSRIAELEGLIVGARQRLAEASREHRAIQRLRERQYHRWRLEVHRRQMVESDDAALGRYARQTRGGSLDVAPAGGR